MKWPIVSIIIPTMDNPDYLSRCLRSILLFTSPIHEIIVVNNGSKGSLYYVQENEKLKILHQDHNLGWMDGINVGAKHARGDYLLFLNDDTQILDGDMEWLSRLIQPFKRENTGAVGPISNVVMGTQNFLNLGNYPKEYETTMLIGFCMLVSRKAYDEVGGLDAMLTGGDDLDFSIRLRSAGYKLVVRRDVFVYHHGFKTGQRVHGSDWTSAESIDKYNMGLIRKHGIKKWHECNSLEVLSEPLKFIDDIEGENIRKLLPESGKVVEVGCGAQKTRDDVIGVDKVEKGKDISTMDARWGTIPDVSKADIQADVFVDAFANRESIDAIIARHILEHAIDPIQAVQLWADMLKPGGQLIIAVPDETLCKSIPLNPDHTHAFTKDSLVRMVEMAVPTLKLETIMDSGNKLSLIGSFKKQ